MSDLIQNRSRVQAGFDNLFFLTPMDWERFEEAFGLEYIESQQTRLLMGVPDLEYEHHVWRMHVVSSEYEWMMAQCLPHSSSFTLGHVRLEGSFAIVTAAFLFLQSNAAYKNYNFGRALYI